MNGCTNPQAANYNPSATVEDYSCIYLEKYNGVCYAFQDVQPDEAVDRSFTASFSLMSKDWVFFHDYMPDFYISGRDKLYNLKEGKPYIHHGGAPGVYHDSTPRSFFVDAVFVADSEMILNSIKWITEVINQDKEAEFSTLTHITVWNNQQCTGRIALSDVFENLSYEVRKTQAIWSFDTFRDMVAVYGTKFLEDLFNNFAVDPTALNMEKPWYEQDLLHDNWFIVRFEFDNSTGNQIVLHGVDIDASKSYR